MKYVKMLGLAAVAAMALVAFGASTASATDLYSTGVKLPVGTTLHATQEPGTTAELISTDGTSVVDTCPASAVHGTISSTGGSTVTASIASLTWSALCSFTTDTLTNGTLHFNSASTATGSGSVVTVNIGVSCRYGTGAGTDLGTQNTGTLRVSAVIHEQEPKQFLCPDSSIWTVEYLITTPHDVTVK